MYLRTDCGVCSEMLFGRDFCLTETGRLICNVNELTGSYIVRAFIERYFRKASVVYSWIPSSKKGSYHKKTSQFICNTNSASCCWKTLLHRLWLTAPSRMDFFFMCYTVTRSTKKVYNHQILILHLWSLRGEKSLK